MAKVTYNSLIKDVRNRMGNVVFSRWKETSYVRSYRKPANPNSPEQMKVRRAFSQLVNIWKDGGSLLRLSWERYARGRNMTGYNAFISINAMRQKSGEVLVLNMPLGEEGLESFGAVQGSSPGEIKCRIVRPAEKGGKHLTLFTLRSMEGLAEGAMTRHDMGVMDREEYLITGLEACGRYFVYAVITDSSFDEATAISASTGVIAEAA